MVVVADCWKRHRYDLLASGIHLHPLLHVVLVVLRYLEVPSRRLVLRHRLFAPLGLVRVSAADAVAPALPSLILLGFRAAFLVLLLAGALVLLPAGALVVLPHPGGIIGGPPLGGIIGPPPPPGGIIGLIGSGPAP